MVVNETERKGGLGELEYVMREMRKKGFQPTGPYKAKYRDSKCT